MYHSRAVSPYTSPYNNKNIAGNKNISRAEEGLRDHAEFGPVTKTTAGTLMMLKQNTSEIPQKF